MDHYYPPIGAAPPAPPLPAVDLSARRRWIGTAGLVLLSAIVGAIITAIFLSL
jgi:hypothetical protein